VSLLLSSSSSSSSSLSFSSLAVLVGGCDVWSLSVSMFVCLVVVFGRPLLSKYVCHINIAPLQPAVHAQPLQTMCAQ
jgi:hypothetical protein